MTTRQQPDHFYQFATQRLSESTLELSLDELFLLWKADSTDLSESLDSVIAVKAAIQDMKKGDAGRSAEQVLTELRQEIKLVTDE